MEIGETNYVTTREEFREWLEKNHETCKDIWLIQYKKFTQKPSIPYVDAWRKPFASAGSTDSKKAWTVTVMPPASHAADRNRIGQIRILGVANLVGFFALLPLKFWQKPTQIATPRILSARRMIEEGKMTEAGLAMLPKDVK